MAVNDIDSPGQVIAIIGRAESGDILNPVYALDETHVESVFENGELVMAYRYVAKTGGNNIYLVRVNYSTDREKYKAYISAYNVLEGLNVDTILPLGFSFDQYIIDYPDRFHRYQQYQTDSETRFFETDCKIEEIESIKVDDTKINNYSTSLSGVTLDHLYPSGHTVTVSYYTIPEIEIEYTLYLMRDNDVLAKLPLYYKFNIDNGMEQKTDKLTSEFFADYDDENLRYFLRCDLDFIDIYTPRSGNDYIYFIFDKEKYISKQTEIKHFAKSLAEHCAMQDAVAGIKAPKINRYDLFNKIMNIKFLLNGDTSFGRYLFTTPSFLNYGDDIDSAVMAIGGLCGRYSSHHSLTNKGINNVVFADQYSAGEIKQLTDAGYTVLYNSIRNGIVPYKAITMAPEDSQYHLLRNIRITNEVSRRFKKATDKYIGGDINLAVENLPEDLDGVIGELKDENKVENITYSLVPISDKQIKIELTMYIRNEITEIKDSIIADIV